MTSPTDTHPDAAFEDEVRAMLTRRATDVGEVDPALPDGIRIAIDRAPDGPSRRGRVLAVAAAVVLVLGLVAVVVGRSTDGPTTEVAEEGPPTTSAPAAGYQIPGLPAGVAAEDLLPFWDEVSSTSPRTDDAPGDVAAGYVKDRIGGVAWSPSEIDGEWAAVVWTVPEVERPGEPVPDRGPDGTVHLRLVDGRWQVVAAVSPTISLAGLAHDGSRVTGEVTESTGAPIEVLVSALDGEELTGAGLTTSADSGLETSVVELGDDEVAVGDQPVSIRVVSGDRPGQVGFDGVGVATIAEVVLAPPSDAAEPPAPTATTAPPTTAPPTEPEEQPSVGGEPPVTTVAPTAPPVGVGGVPAPDGLPGGTDLATVPALLTGAEGDDARDVGLAYLDDRLQRAVGGAPLGLSEPAPGLDAERWAVLRWELLSELEDLPSGFLVLRRDDTAWSVVAATTDGVDLGGVRRDGDAVTGTIGADGIDSLAVDVTDLAGTPVPDSPDPGLPEDLLPGQRAIGTAGEATGTVTIDVPVPPEADVAIQARYVGGTILSIAEVALTV